MTNPVEHEMQSNPVSNGKVVIRVSSKANVHNLSDSLQTHILAGHSIEVAAVGAGAVNQAIKSIAVARVAVGKQGYEITIKPYFKDVMMDEFVPNGEGKEEKVSIKKSCICLFIVVQKGVPK